MFIIVDGLTLNSSKIEFIEYREKDDECDNVHYIHIATDSDYVQKYFTTKQAALDFKAEIDRELMELYS
jgi:hypothetical protein